MVSWITSRKLVKGCRSPVVLFCGIAALPWQGADASDPGRRSLREALIHDEEKPAEEGLEGHFEDEMTVSARADDLTGVALSATEGATGSQDLEKRPILRAGEIIETVPGAIATQHSGGGKANQYFLRGFNLDHGTDLSLRVDGMPVNLPTHGHGQGYADMNFLIPELIDSVQFRKGTYFAGVGDFSAAGSSDIRLKSELAENEVRVGLGSFDFQRALLLASTSTGGGELLGAFDYNHYDGPWDKPDDFEKINGLLRYSRSGELHRWVLTAMAYEGDWQSTDQIPLRTAGVTVPRFGFVDPFPNGDSSRYSLSGEVHWHGESSLTTLGAYWIGYDLNLVSNFTYCLEYGTENQCDVEDDQFLQTDDRQIYGLRWLQSRSMGWARRNLTWRYGADVEYHDIENGLSRAVSGGFRPAGLIAGYEVQQLMAGVFGDVEIQWAKSVRTLAGLRGDFYDADVRTELRANSGQRDDSILNPKLSVILGPWKKTELYLNWGQGFHSNDARGWVANVDPVTLEPIDSADPLVRAQGADVGVRTTAVAGLQSTLTVFYLDLDSELVFLGDSGTTEPGPPSRRSGIELANFYRIRPWISLDLDVTLTDAEFTDVPTDEREIPGSVGRTLQFGVVLGRPLGWFGTLRWRYFGDIPLTEDGLVRGRSSSLVNGRLGYGFRNGLQLIFEGFNLLDRYDPDIQYYYASRLPAELSPSGLTEPTSGVDDVHFHPMESRSFRFWLEYRF